MMSAPSLVCGSVDGFLAVVQNVKRIDLNQIGMVWDDHNEL